jgi:HK97 family phage prohead protease
MSLMPYKVADLAEWKQAARAGRAPQGVLLQKELETQVRAVDPERRQIRFRITTGAPDRMRDVIDPKGWDLRNYLKNPVVLFAHNYEGLPVARAVEVTADAGGLSALAEFATKEVYPFADHVYQLIKGGFLQAVSVGFKPIKHVYNEARGGVDFLQQELLEFSVVPIPANPAALVEAKRVGGDGRDIVILDDDEDTGLSVADVRAAIREVVPGLVHAAMARARDDHQRIDIDIVDDDFDPLRNPADARLLAEACKAAIPQLIRAEANRLRGRID